MNAIVGFNKTASGKLLSSGISTTGISAYIKGSGKENGDF